MESQEKYLGSKKRLLLSIVCTSLVVYTMIGDFPEENKILALAILPMCIIHFRDWLRWQR